MRRRRTRERIAGFWSLSALGTCEAEDGVRTTRRVTGQTALTDTGAGGG